MDALSCVANTRFAVSPNGKTDLHKTHALHVTGIGNDGYVRLRGEPKLELRARMYYEVIHDDRLEYGPLRVTTRGYDYSLRTADGCEVVDYHWHPLGKSHVTAPHLHLGEAQLRHDAVLSSKDHLPTGRITFEAVVRIAINSGATPLHADHEKRLAATEDRHVRHRTWHVRPPT
jgi:hypothetical protein